MANKRSQSVKGGPRNELKHDELQIPEKGGIISIDYCDMFSELAWPTEMGPLDVLLILRRTMHVRSESVSLYFVGGKNSKTSKLKDLRNLSPSMFESLETATLMGSIADEGAIWQRESGLTPHFVAGIVAGELRESRLNASLLGTGAPILKKYADEMTSEVIRITQGSLAG